jgi:hypothetical protein
MNCASNIQPKERVRVSRTEFRNNQRDFLDKAKGRTVVVITSSEKEEGEKLVIDKQYFDDIMQKLKAYFETLEVAKDTKLLNKITAAAQSLDDDLRHGRLHSMDNVFSED